MAEPKIRFKREDGSSYPEWVPVSFSKLTKPAGIKNKNDANLESYSISNEKGFVPQNEQFEDAGYLNDADRTMYYIVSPGSFAYNPARINVGSIGYQNVGKDVLVSSLYEIFNTSDELDDTFLFKWFRTAYFQKYVRMLSEGGVRQYFYYDKLCMIKFPLPCLEEQHKIADFLTSVDEVIAASEAEVQNLETQKKAVMKKIFSQEVRFKREDGTEFPEWDDKAISEIAEIKNGPFGSVLHAGDYVENGIPIITTEHFKNGFLCSYSSKLPQVSARDYERLKGYRLQTGDIVFSRVGSIDINAETNEEQDGWLFSGRVLRVRLQNTYNSKYIHYALLCDDVRNSIVSRAVGQTMPSINTGILGETRIIIPCLEEQRLIADFLAEYDEAISSAKRELELWKELKKGLLQQMFV